MQVNPEDGPPEINVTWSDPRMTDFENTDQLPHSLVSSSVSPILKFTDYRLRLK